MANQNEWSQLYSHNQTLFTTSTTTSTAVTTTGETTSTDSRLSAETGRVTKPARKRSRASRRTPTTLLNTDTSNFRSMVQQFTGGPFAMTFSSGFSLTSSDPSAGSSPQTSWQYNIQPQRPYMFSLSNVNPVVGYGNMNNHNTVVSDVFGTADGGGGSGSVPSSKEATISNTSSSRLQ